MNPFERHDAITHALLQRLDSCPVRMLSRPYLAACWHMMNGELRGMEPAQLATWTTMVNARLETIGQLLEEYPPIDSDVGHRFVAALLYAIERDTRALPDAPEHVSALLFGTRELDALLREIGEPPALVEAPTDPVHVATLATVARLHWGDVAIPIVAGSRPRFADHPVYAADGDHVWAMFDLGGSIEAANAFYLTWAHEEGWRHVPVSIDHVIRDIPEPTIHVVKGTRRCGVFLVEQGHRLNVRLDRTSKELFDESETAVYHPGVGESVE